MKPPPVRKTNTALSKAFVPILFAVSMVAVVLLQKGAIFFLLAMLPALMAFFIDNHPERPTFKTVCAANLAATMPSLAPMIHAGINMRTIDVSSAMGNPATWLFVYGGAATGWCLVFLCRMVARFMMTLTYEYRVIKLEKMQKRLTEEWGTLIHPEI